MFFCFVCSWREVDVCALPLTAEDDSVEVSQACTLFFRVPVVLVPQQRALLQQQTQK